MAPTFAKTNHMKYFFSLFGRLTPVILSFLLLAAHFSRNDQAVPVVLSVLFPLILLFRHPAVPRIIQFILILGGAEWVRSMLEYLSVRKAAGEDWLRLAIILSVVALFTVLSGFALETRKLKEHYRK